MNFDHKKYNQEYRKTHPSVNVYMDIGLHSTLKKMAEKKAVSTSNLTKLIIYAYFNKTFVCLHDNYLTLFMRDLRKACTNINQITSKYHSTGFFDAAKFRLVLEQLQRIENNQKVLLEEPKDFFEYAEERIEKEPELLGKMKEFLAIQEAKRDSQINKMEKRS